MSQTTPIEAQSMVVAASRLEKKAYGGLNREGAKQETTGWSDWGQQEEDGDWGLGERLISARKPSVTNDEISPSFTPTTPNAQSSNSHFLESHKSQPSQQEQPQTSNEKMDTGRRISITATANVSTSFELDREIEAKRNKWEQEWEQLEMEREAEEQKLKNFRANAQAERDAFYAQLMEEHKGMVAQMNRQAVEQDALLLKQKAEWTVIQTAEYTALRRAKEEWAQEHAAQLQEFESEKASQTRQTEMLRTKLRREKDAFVAAITAERQREQEVINQQQQQLNEEHQKALAASEAVVKRRLAQMEEEFIGQIRLFEADKTNVLTDIANKRRATMAELRAKGKLTIQSVECSLMYMEDQMAEKLATQGLLEQHFAAQHKEKLAEWRSESDSWRQKLMRFHHRIAQQMKERLAMHREDVDHQMHLQAQTCDTYCNELGEQMKTARAKLNAAHSEAIREQNQSRLMCAILEENNFRLSIQREQSEENMQLIDAFLSHLTTLLSLHFTEQLRQHQLSHQSMMNQTQREVSAVERRLREAKNQLEDIESQVQTRFEAAEKEIEERKERREREDYEEREKAREEWEQERREAERAVRQLREEATQLHNANRKAQRELQESFYSQFAHLTDDRERERRSRQQHMRRVMEDSVRKTDQMKCEGYRSELQRIRDETDRKIEEAVETQRISDERALQAYNARWQLGEDAILALGRVLGEEAAAFAVLELNEREWRPLTGCKWIEDRRNQLLRRETQARDRQLCRERDDRHLLWDQFHESRRAAELAARDNAIALTRRGPMASSNTNMSNGSASGDGWAQPPKLHAQVRKVTALQKIRQRFHTVADQGTAQGRLRRFASADQHILNTHSNQANMGKPSSAQSPSESSASPSGGAVTLPPLVPAAGHTPAGPSSRSSSSGDPISPDTPSPLGVVETRQQLASVKSLMNHQLLAIMKPREPDLRGASTM